ncbi:peptide ABC transporter substrate-binding protein [Patescibacteria group bacterium]|nr:peptide ABC transporter substrate-binding protein [Patescibacteria group bacterium]
MVFYQIFKSLNKKEKAVLYIAGTVFLVSSILWLSYFINHNTIQVPVESDKYSEGTIGQPKFINPIISNNDIDRDLSQILYSDMTTLMDDYTVSDDGKTWNVFLKNDLLWSDNKRLTSDDVIFTIETIQNPEANSPMFGTWQGIIVDRISELEIEFNLRNPYAFFLDNLEDLKIIPNHIFSIIPSSNLKLSSYNLEPIGSGPYQYVDYDIRKDGFITEYNFKINPNYIGEKPFIKNLTIKFFQGSEELIDAFNSRKIDGFGNLNPKNIDKIKLSHKLTSLEMPRYYAIFFNQNIHEALKQESVREALNIATDKKTIIKNVLDEKGSMTSGPILSIIDGYDKEIKIEEFSIENSIEILEKAKWKINEETGIREKKIGKDIVKLEFQIIVPQIQFLIDTANLIKNNWREIGVELTLIKLNPNDINEVIIKSRDYQMLIFGNILKNNPDIFSFWHSSERFYPGLNLSLFQNEKADTLMETIRKEMDSEKRIEEIKNLQTLINTENPAIFLFSPYYLYVSIKNLDGLEGNTLITSSDRFKNINEWYVATSRAFK